MTVMPSVFFHDIPNAFPVRDFEPIMTKTMTVRNYWRHILSITMK